MLIAQPAFQPWLTTQKKEAGILDAFERKAHVYFGGSWRGDALESKNSCVAASAIE